MFNTTVKDMSVSQDMLMCSLLVHSDQGTFITLLDILSSLVHETEVKKKNLHILGNATPQGELGAAAFSCREGYLFVVSKLEGKGQTLSLYNLANNVNYINGNDVLCWSMPLKQNVIAMDVHPLTSSLLMVQE